MNSLKAFKVACGNRSGLNCKFCIPRGAVPVPNSILYPRHHVMIRSYNERKLQQPNGHIFVNSQSIRRRNSTRKVRRNFINFERRIHVEIMTSIRPGNFGIDSTFKIDEISMSSPRRVFYVVSTSNRRNFCTRCFHSTRRSHIRFFVHRPFSSIYFGHKRF